MASYTGNPGNETVTGTAGTDTLTLAGSLRDARFTFNGRIWIVTTPAGGIDRLSSIEKVRFADGTVTLAPPVLDGLGNVLVPATLTGTTLGDLLFANGPSVRLLGSTGEDRLMAGYGADQLDGGLGDDTMEGGAGDDTYFLSGRDTIFDSGGIDTAVSDASFALAYSLENGELTGSDAADIAGNARANRLTGNAAVNVLDGGGGVDTLVGGSGNDIYITDADNFSSTSQDQVVEDADAGTDTVFSSATLQLAANVENLHLTGPLAINGTGNDLDNLLVGNAAANVLNGLGGNDTMVGGAGDDQYFVSDLDSVHEEAGEGTDRVVSAASWTLGDALEDLTLTGSAAVNGTGNELANVLDGNEAANALDGGAGADTLRGADGADTYIVDSTLDQVVEYGWHTGVDQVRASASHSLADAVENLTLVGTAGIDGTGNWLDNVIRGNSGGNVLDGGAGDDLIHGNAGDDVLDDGDAGRDTLVGGLGDDVYLVTGAEVRELAGQGIDTVRASAGASYVLDAHVENLELSGSVWSGAGNDLANRITGSEFANVLDGGAGADTLAGGDGDDTYVVDAADVVVERFGRGVDEVVSAFSQVLRTHVENGTLTGNAAAGLTGQGLANRLIGNGAANVLRGQGGNDDLSGRMGNDRLYGGDGDDVLEGVLGNDLLDGGAGIDVADYRTATGGVTIDLAVTDAQSTAMAGFDTLVGIESVLGTLVYDDALSGAAGANTLRGYGGNDTLDGAGGNDRLEGGEGDDQLVDGAGNAKLDGGNGFDVVSYFGARTGVVVSLEETTIQNTVGAGADLILNVEGLAGSNLGNDSLTGDAGHNLLRGEGGHDTLAGDAGDDTLTGGAGTDLASYRDSPFAVRVDLSIAGAQDTGGAGVDLLSGIEGLVGSAWANDYLTGDDGANFIDGASGKDTMTGGAGEDTYVVDSLRDVVVETASVAGEVDTVRSSIGYTLGADLEDLVLLGDSAIDGTGNALANTLTGNAAGNTLTGGSGDDVLSGLGGNDVLVGGADRDVFRFAAPLAGAGIDTIRTFDAADDRIQLENAVFRAAGPVGQLSANAFRVGSAAGDALDRIVYDNTNGKLYYDADGTGAAAAVQIATIVGAPTISHLDFFVI